MNILLHICCGVCAARVAEKLMCDGHSVTGYFYNPNIHPEDEYLRRLAAARKVSEELKFDIVDGPYDRQRWFELVKGKEYDKEGGARCLACYEMRLKKTYDEMRKNNFDAFTTTLTISPHKDADAINKIGRAINEDKFLCYDFKKKGGFQRAMALAAEMGLYKQNYCGCIYSLEASYAREKKTGSEGDPGEGKKECC
jgi:predicted adenine nucleotide alpha hydrolase (AANH) superfamily ATPase